MENQVARIAYGYLCLLCNTKVKTTGSIKRHMSEQHLERDFVYMCPACKKSYDTRASFYSHIHVYHPDLKGLDPDRFKMDRT